MATYFVLTGTKECLILRIDKTKILFDQKVKSGKGVIFGVKIVGRKSYPTKETPEISKKKVPKNELHQILGHPSSAKTTVTAKKFGYKADKLVDFKDKDCSLGKQTQKMLRRPLTGHTKTEVI